MRNLIIIFCKSILLYSVIVSLTHAECDWLSPSNVIVEKKTFILKYQISINKPSIALKGYLTKVDAEQKKNSGIFLFPISPYSINLTGSEGPERRSIKKFILYKKDFVEFVPDDKKPHKYVNGGFFDDSIWSDCPVNPDGSTGCSIHKHTDKYTCIKMRGQVYYGPYNTHYPEPYPEPYIESETIMTPDTTIISVISSGKNLRDLKEEKLSSIVSKVKSPSGGIKGVFEKKIKKDGTSTKNNLSKIAKKVLDKKVITIKKEAKLCDTNGKRLSYDFFKMKFKSYAFLGLIKNNKKTKAFWFDAEIATDPSPEKFTIDLSSLKKQYIPIAYPEYLKKGANGIIPITFKALSSLPRKSLSAKSNSKNHKIIIVVIGDANSISFSGIQKAEQILLKKIKTKFNWEIHWFNVDTNGSLSPKEIFTSFKELVSKVKTIKKTKVLLSNNSQFTSFLKNFEKTVLQYKDTIAYVLWVKDSYSLPLKSPDLFNSTLKNIHKYGELSRFKDGRPYQWLYILSGNMAGGNRSLLEEPMARLDPIPGQIEEEKAMLEPRRLLQRPRRLALALESTVRRQMKSLPEELIIPPENLFVNAKEALAKIGLLIPIKDINNNKKTMKINKAILEKIRKKDYTGVSRNKCTHIFFSEEEMGLNWLK